MVIPQVRLFPALTVENSASGTSRWEPWLLESSPQHSNLPSVRTAQAWSAPMLTELNLPSGADNTRVNLPHARPQQTTSPSEVSAQASRP